MAFPTDTLYGLGADAFRSGAVARVFEIKGRSATAPLPLLLGNIDDLEQVVADVPAEARVLADHFWPGPLTLVLKKCAAVPDIVTGGRDSVAVRVPNHPVPLALVGDLGRPITGTSANPSGWPDPLTAAEVGEMLGDRVDCIVDWGPAAAGTPSTILDLTGRTPRLLREGAIALDTLRSICPTPIEVP